MEKSKLKQYNDIKGNIEYLKNKISKLENLSAMVTDSVQNGYKRRLVITGVDIKNVYKLESCYEKLQSQYNKLSRLQGEIEKFIESMENIRISRILTYRYLEDMSWIEVAEVIGGKATADSVRKEHERFLKEFN